MQDILKNETVQTVILMAIIIASVAAFWFGLRFALRTDYPILAVASGSMEDTLFRGDLIIVQGVLNACDIKAGYLDAEEPGDIIIFHKPNDGELIVHRAVKKVPQGDGSFYFKTKGDKYWHPGDKTTDPWDVKETDIVGKFVGKVSWLGYVPLFIREMLFPFLSTPLGFAIVILVILSLILLDYIPLKKKRAEAKKPSPYKDIT